MTSNSIVAEFVEKSLVWDFVKGFGEIQQDDVDLVSSRTHLTRNALDSCHKLCNTRSSFTKTVLLDCQDVLIEVAHDVAV